ncbi:MAG: hypothetical protein FJ027_12045 [Candidatus Rokubacteria bacterium]|nr:hypothetical protein [Candidatus Rokubacteria bacterium]
MDLRRREDQHFLVLTARPLGVLRRVGVEVASLHGVLEHLLQDHHHVADRFRRESVREQRLEEFLTWSSTISDMPQVIRRT